MASKQKSKTPTKAPRETKMIEVKAITTEPESTTVRRQALKEGSTCVSTQPIKSNMVVTVAGFSAKSAAKNLRTWLETKHPNWLAGTDDIRLLEGEM